MKKSNFSKDRVYQRLLKSAAELWEIHESDLDSMDPMAKMLLGATAKEIERIGNELYSSDARIFNRLSNFLLPDEMQTAIPAHSILRLDPSEPGDITRYDAMTFQKRWKDRANLNKEQSIDIQFSAAGDFAMNNSKLAYRISGGKLLSVNNLRLEDELDVDHYVPANEVYLAFRKKGKQSEKFRLFIDWTNHPDRPRLLNHVSKIQIFETHEKGLEQEAGLGNSEHFHDLKSSIQATTKLEQKVLNYYRKQFIRFTWEWPEDGEETPNPNWLNEVLAEQGERNPQQFRWLKLVFPPDYAADEVRDTVVLDNCVPCLNRSLQKVIFRLNNDLNIRRLDFNNYFLEMEQAESSHGKVYDACPSLDLSTMEAGSYNLRIGGTGRLDERDGYEYLNYLLDLLRDEKQSFAALDVTSTIADLNEIEQILQKVKKRVDDIDRGSKQPYVIVKPFTKAENAHLYFWSTDGEQANGIGLNSALRCKNPGLAKSGRAYVVSKSRGGSNEKDGKQMIQSFRNALLSRGFVVTRRDIVALCKEIAGEQLTGVSIENGIETSNTPGVGLTPTIDVKISLSAQLKSPQEREHLRNEIESELLARSNFAKLIRLTLTQKHGKRVEKVA